MKTIGYMYLCVGEKMCFGQKRGYLDKMADNSAIFNWFQMKLSVMKENVRTILNMKYELPTYNR